MLPLVLPLACTLPATSNNAWGIQVLLGHTCQALFGYGDYMITIMRSIQDAESLASKF